MGDYNSPPSMSGLFADLQSRVGLLELSAAGPNIVSVTGATANDTSATTKAANVAAFNAAITLANSRKCHIGIPAGTYYFSDASTLTTLAWDGCAGWITYGKATLVFNNPAQDCLVIKGMFKRCIGSIFVDNQATTTTGTTVRFKNVAYGRFDQIYARADGSSSTAVLVEQEYTGTAEDAFLLVHLGCWYNDFSGITAIYGVNGSTGGNIGDGLKLSVNANAVSVVNPTGEPAGTYTGSIAHNTFLTPNIEGKAAGLNLDRAEQNTFMGGQFIGCATQIKGRNNANGNIFLGIRGSQPGTNFYDLDSSCFGNIYVGPITFPTGVLGNLGSSPVVLMSPWGATGGDATTLAGVIRSNAQLVGFSGANGETQLSSSSGASGGRPRVNLGSDGACWIGRSNTGEVEVGDKLIFPTAVTAAGASNNCLFRDSADNKLKFKDNGGTVNLLY